VRQVDVQFGRDVWVNMGPQHPSTHGVLKNRSAHRRRDGPGSRAATDWLPAPLQGKDRREPGLTTSTVGYTDRLDYLAAMNNNHAWAMACEKLAGIEVPPRGGIHPRGKPRSSIVLASHLVSLGAYGTGPGGLYPVSYAFRDRRVHLDLFEQLWRSPPYLELHKTSAESPGTCPRSSWRR